MNKEALFSFLEGQMKGLTVEEKLEEIERLKRDRIFDEFEKRLTLGLYHCPHCKRYFEENDKTNTFSEIKTVKEFVYYGGGFNDEYRECDLTYKYYYKRCPICSKLIIQKRDYIEGLEKLIEANPKESWFLKRMLKRQKILGGKL